MDNYKKLNTMSTLKIQRDANATHHKNTHRRLVEVVSQEVVDVEGVKEDLRNAIMKTMTKSHILMDKLLPKEKEKWAKQVDSYVGTM